MYEGETGGSAILLFLKINLSTIISMTRSRRELSIDMAIIFKNNQSTLSPCFTFIPKTGVSFYRAYVTDKTNATWITRSTLSETISLFPDGATELGTNKTDFSVPRGWHFEGKPEKRRPCVREGWAEAARLVLFTPALKFSAVMRRISTRDIPVISRLLK